MTKNQIRIFILIPSVALVLYLLVVQPFYTIRDITSDLSDGKIHFIAFLFNIVFNLLLLLLVASIPSVVAIYAMACIDEIKIEEAKETAERQRREAERQRIEAKETAERQRREAERQRIEAEETAERQRIKEAKERDERKKQATLHTQLVSCVDDTAKHLENMPENLKKAETVLDVAENEFSRGNFARFWTAAEEAVTLLGSHSDAIEQIERNLKNYASYTEEFNEKPPKKFPLPLKYFNKNNMIDKANPTTQRLDEIVRKAQEDFHFASIYEQRKTNRILITGFTTLGDAIMGIGSRIEYSINSLESSVKSMSVELVDSIDEINVVLKNTAEQNAKHHSQRIEMGEERERQNTERHSQLIEAEEERERQDAERHSQLVEAEEERERQNAKRHSQSIEIEEEMQKGIEEIAKQNAIILERKKKR